MAIMIDATKLGDPITNHAGEVSDDRRRYAYALMRVKPSSFRDDVTSGDRSRLEQPWGLVCKRVFFERSRATDEAERLTRERDERLASRGLTSDEEYFVLRCRIDLREVALYASTEGA